MTIVTRDILMQPSGDGNGRNLTATFIRKHDREMGGRGKPRRYDLAVVDDFLHRYFRELLHQAHAVKQQTEQLHRDIDSYIKTARSAHEWPREMVGRGGRGFDKGTENRQDDKGKGQRQEATT